MQSNPTVQWLAMQCQSAALDEKWLLVDQLRAGQSWKDRLALAGHWHVNLHARTMRQLGISLSAPLLMQVGKVPAQHSTITWCLHGLLKELMAQGQLIYFNNQLPSLDGLCELLTRSYSDWRLAQLNQDALLDKCFEVSEKAHDLRLLFAGLQLRLETLHVADEAECLLAAIAGVKQGSVTLPPKLHILQPESIPLAHLELQLLQLLEEHGATWSIRSDSVRDSDDTSTLPGPSMPVIEIFSGAGEVNEVRGVFAQLLHASPTPLSLDQVEIAYTDARQYVPLIFECLSQWLITDGSLIEAGTDVNDGSPGATLEELPVTFAEGIACIYSRPGRLLRLWVRWAREQFVQSKAVQMLREGLLARPPTAEPIGYARLASTLRRVPIGFQIERYLPQIDRELLSARQQAAAYTESSGHADRWPRDFGIPALEAVQAIVETLIRLAPRPDQSPTETLQAARELLQIAARLENKFDRYARDKLLDDIDGMLAQVATHSYAPMNVLAWLEALPLSSRIIASGPRPGCVYVVPLELGGVSGRPQTFVLGLDDHRFPKAKMVDPILLDSERQRLSGDLQTSDTIAKFQGSALQRVIDRLKGVEAAHVRLSYAHRDLAADRAASPSQALLKQPFDPQAVQAFSFLDARFGRHLTSREAQLADYLLTGSATQKSVQLHQQFPHLAARQQAHNAQMLCEFGPYDGWVSKAGSELIDNITSRPMSPSRLETFGACPRRYFFSRALGIVAPDEWNIDADRWLSPLELGSFLHELFEDFMLAMVREAGTPDPARHTARIQQMLDSQMAAWSKRVPIQNQDSYRRQRDELLDYCEIFLHKEAEYARDREAVPWIMEVSLGSERQDRSAELATPLDTSTPIEIALADGRVLKLAGRVDRIDKIRIDAAHSGSDVGFLVWDYKTGSDFGYAQEDPFKQGRKLQPWLYVRMLQERLRHLGMTEAPVVGFGYFFPSPKCEGLRLEWRTERLHAGDEVLGQLMSLVAAGAFIATTNDKDCDYCDYATVCGPARDLIQISRLKASNPANTTLAPYRTLRQL